MSQQEHHEKRDTAAGGLVGLIVGLIIMYLLCCRRKSVPSVPNVCTPAPIQIQVNGSSTAVSIGTGSLETISISGASLCGHIEWEIDTILEAFTTEYFSITGQASPQGTYSYQINLANVFAAGGAYRNLYLTAKDLATGAISNTVHVTVS